MTTLILENDETKDAVLPSFTTATSICNDMTIIESALLLDANQHNQHQQQHQNLIEVDKDVEKLHEIFLKRNDFQSATISFSNINYTIGDQRSVKTKCFSWLAASFPLWKPVSSKQILTDVSAMFTPGMNAILGPTGCGKSTLLDILADRKYCRGLSGNVFVSGQPRPTHYKYVIGYVIQEDIISGTLTVRENLLFSANVRLPRSMNIKERIDRVNQVIHDLDLYSCADTLIGTDSVRGVSGGEKKRTSIGMELVLSPNILFLDEPTTGLDASTAQSVMLCLHNLSRQGRTIIFSIHQPRYSIFKLFDTILFLSAGHNIYFGPSNEILPYFTSNGFECEEHNNPADFVLDVLIQSNITSQKLATIYQRSKLCSSISEKMKNEQNDNEHQDYSLSKSDSHRSYKDEFYYVTLRTFCNVIRDPALAVSQFISVIIYGLFTGVIFNKLETLVDPGVYNRFGAIFFIISCQVLSSMSALEPLIKERVLFIHENVSGYYRVSSFFLAKLIIDLPLVHIVPAIIYSTITFFLTGLRRSKQQFWIFLLTNLVAKICGTAMCYFVAASTSKFGVALVVVICGYVTMMLFSGFLIDLTSIITSLRWMKWISVFRYASNVLAINEFRNLTLCLSSHSDTCLMTGEEVLSRRHIPYATQWDLWQNILGLFLIAIAFFVMAYLQLLRIKKFTM